MSKTDTNERKNTQGMFATANTATVSSSRIIYTASAFARTSLFHLQETGTLQALHPHTSHRKDMSSFLFFTVLSGSGTLEYEGKEYDLRSGDCVFINCGTSYAHSTGRDLWKLKWAHFYGPNMSEVYEKYRDRGGMPVFHPKEADRYIRNLDELYQIAESLSYVRDMEIHTKLSELLVFLMQDAWQDMEGECRGHHHNNRPRVVDIREVKEYLDGHFTQKMSLDELAAAFYINKFYLLKLFKGRYGTTVNDYLITCRITKAKRLLRFTDKTVEEISCECGLGSAAYMSRLFKKIEGVSPSEYRKQW